MPTPISFQRSFTAPSLLLGLWAAGCGVEPVTQVPAEPSSEVGESPGYAEGITDAPRDNAFWWPEQLDLGPLRRNTAPNPYGEFDYAKAFAALDLDAVKADIEEVLTDSQDWWPADYGNYGPFFVRLAWHSAGTYRASDGRGGSDGGQIRFEPLNSWPDNGNLDKARRLLLPVKQTYGRSLSWADLIVLSGNVAIESMGLKTLGFSGGRVDDWEADLVYWGPEGKMLASHDRFHGQRELHEPLAATRMGLIYVNPEGPDGNPDPVAAADDIRQTFALMGMDDRETVALIAGGHTFGKAHGAAKPADCVGKEPAGSDLADQDLGWKNRCGTGHGADTITSGLEGAWTADPARWTHMYFANLYSFDWVKTESPAGATQWKPDGDAGAGMVPDAHDASKRHAPMMFTTDLSLREDGAYDEISRGFMQDPASFERAFAEAWFKLIHRDLGPASRYVGRDVPAEIFTWQDPLPEAKAVPSPAQMARLAAAIRDSDVDSSALVRVAWASASTFRNSDMRGGANGARIRLEPQIGWALHDGAEIREVVDALESVRTSTGIDVSLADLIVLAGAVAIEDAAAGLTVPVVPGRVDARQDQTDVTSFAFLEPRADAFRNHYTADARLSPADALVDRAALLGLSVAETTALLGGLRVLGANAGGSKAGVFTDRPGTLTHDFFVNLLDVSTEWSPRGDVFEGRAPDGSLRWTATEVDLVFGSNAELRAVSEAFAHDEALFHQVFVSAWTKVMQADRFDLHR